jgi:hypothetical protein
MPASRSWLLRPEDERELLTLIDAARGQKNTTSPMRAAALVIAAALLLSACGAKAGSPQPGGNTEIALRALVRSCAGHGGVQAYSFRYQTTKYLWTAICKDGEPIVVGGD